MNKVNQAIDQCSPVPISATQAHHLTLLRQQTALGKFGEFALTSGNLDHILTEACRLVAAAVGTELAKVMALQEDGEIMLVRAGVGWKEGIVGKLTLIHRMRCIRWASIRRREA
jgi:hypothetical protein